MKKTVMIMIDGFGVPAEGWHSSIYAKYAKKGFVDLFSEFSRPISADLGVKGVPQSATGQTALFTGLNAAEVIGRHSQGFPGPTLRKLIRQQNLFSTLIKKGFQVTFANSYARHTLQKLAELRMRSVTTVMTEISLGTVRNLKDLLDGNAVYHDLTRKSMPESFNVDSILPEDAACDLANIAEKNDFTLFEYFLTDREGHKQDSTRISTVLSEFSSFFCRLIELAEDKFRLILTSDHGNCEDPSTRHHTKNPVPFFLYGEPQPGCVNSILDVYNYITESDK
jgi:hypothetical protein